MTVNLYSQNRSGVPTMAGVRQISAMSVKEWNKLSREVARASPSDIASPETLIDIGLAEVIGN
jgi:hypothetical protein